VWQDATIYFYVKVCFERMPCGALLPALKWMEAALNTYCFYYAPMVSSFDSDMLLEN
jgi:hypothetical protein